MALPFQPCPGVLRILFHYTSAGQAVENVIHVDRSGHGEWSLGDIQTIVTYCATTFWTTYLKPLVCSTTTLDYVQGTDLSAQNSQQYTNTLVSGNAGTAAGNSMPNSVTLAIKLFTGFRARGYNGRIFMPTIPVSKVTGDTVDSTHTGNWIAALNQLNTELPVLVAGSYMGVLSRVLAGARRAAGITRPVTLIEAADESVDVAKRRLPNHKRKKRHTP